MPALLPYSVPRTAKVMMFVDGENLAIRYGAMLGDSSPKSHVIYAKDVLVWSSYASRSASSYDFVRRHYYTSVQGDVNRRREIEELLKKSGVEAPRVFQRHRDRRSKRVDITLTTEMLTHAHRKNFDVAVLVAGDEDYVPLVEAVKAEGCRVCLWFVENGLSPALKLASDHFWDIGELLIKADPEKESFHVIYG